MERCLQINKRVQRAPATPPWMPCQVEPSSCFKCTPHDGATHYTGRESGDKIKVGTTENFFNIHWVISRASKDWSMVPADNWEMRLNDVNHRASLGQTKAHASVLTSLGGGKKKVRTGSRTGKARQQHSSAYTMNGLGHVRVG